MPRLQCIDQGSVLSLHKTAGRQALALAGFTTIMFVLWAALTLVYTRGRAAFDPVTGALFPLLFAVPLAFAPPAWNAWRAARGLDRWRFDRNTDGVYRDDVRLVPLAAITAVILRQRAGQDVDTFCLELAQRGGGVLKVDESVDGAALRAAGTQLAAFLRCPLEQR